MKLMSRKSVFISLFIFSFLFFVYWTFPYEVIKESVTSEISRSTGMNVFIKSLGPNFPFGIEANGVQLESGVAGVAAELQAVDVNVSVPWLALGQLKLIVSVEGPKGKGTLDLATRLSLLSMVSGKPLMPSMIMFEADEFPLDNFVKFLLAYVSTGPGANPMIAPLLAKIGFTGKLNANIDLDLDVGEPTQSNGTLEIKFSDASLILSDPSLALPDQKFSKALIRARLDSGTLAFDDASGLTAEELDFGLQGRVTLRPVLPSSMLDLKLPIKLSGGLQSSFGFILGAISGGASNGSELTYGIRGTLGEVQANPI